jgi:hypothetical protein
MSIPIRGSGKDRQGGQRLICALHDKRTGEREGQREKGMLVCFRGGHRAGGKRAGDGQDRAMSDEGRIMDAVYLRDVRPCDQHDRS